MNGGNQNTVQIEIGVEKLESLFNKGEVCAYDIRCLNCETKKCVRDLCLRTCVRSMQCNHEQVGCQPYCEKSEKNTIKAFQFLITPHKDI